MRQLLHKWHWAIVLAIGTTALCAEPLALRSALAAAYPQVQRWEVRPLGSEQWERADAAAQDTVVLLGARSAVRSAAGKIHWYAVRGLRPGLVASAALAASSPVTAAQTAVGEVDVLHPDCHPTLEADLLRGVRTRGVITAGAPFCAELLEAMPLVRRGEAVVVRSVSGGLALSGRGTALGDARAGQSVAVRTTYSSSVVQAVAVGPAEVVVHVAQR